MPSTSQRSVLVVKPLSTQASSVMLRSFFSQFGHVTRANVPRHNDTGRPLAYGFVEFASRVDAWTAIQKVDGRQMDAAGPCLNVSWSNESKPPGKDVCIRGLPKDTSSIEISDICAPFALPTDIDLMIDRASGEFLHCAFLRFSNDADAYRVLNELDGFVMRDRTIRASFRQCDIPQGTELAVDFLPPCIDHKAIRSMFTQFGRVLDLDLMRELPSDAKWRHGFVSFLRAEDAARAIDELDGHTIKETTIRVNWSRRSRPSGVHVRLINLDRDADRRVLVKLFERFDGVRRIEVENNRLTGASLEYGHITFGTREQAESAVRALGGRLLPHGEWGIDMPKVVIEREVSRLRHDSQVTTLSRCVPASNVDAEEAQASGDVLRPLGQCAARKVTSGTSVHTIPTSVLTRASLTNTTSQGPTTQDSVLVDSVTDPPQCPPSEDVANAEGIEKRKLSVSSEVVAFVSTVDAPLVHERREHFKIVKDLLTDQLISVPITSSDATSEAVPKDLISFDDPQRSSRPPLDEPRDESGSVRSANGGQSIDLRCFAVPESEKQEKVGRIILNDAEPIDPNNNSNGAMVRKTTLVVRDLDEMRSMTDKLTQAGIDAFICDDRSVRGGHSWHPTEGISVHVTERPLADNVRYSEHIIFLRPSDDVAATLELLRTRKTDVTTVSVLYDKGCPSESVRMAHMLSVDGPWPQSGLESCGVEGISR